MQQGARAGKFLDPHRLAEQVALHQIETQAVRGDKIGAGFDALGDRARAMVLGQLDDLAAHRLFQPVIRAAGDKLMIDLQLDERKVPKPHQRRPLGADIVDHDRNIMKADLPCDIDHEIQIVDDLGAVDLDQQAAERRMVGHARGTDRVPLPRSPRNETGMLIERSTGPCCSSR